MKTTCFCWPDHIIGKRESRQIREAHNAIANEHAELVEIVIAWERWRDNGMRAGNRPLRDVCRALLARVKGGA